MTAKLPTIVAFVLFSSSALAGLAPAEPAGLAPAASAAGLSLRSTTGGTLHFPGGSLSIVAFLPGWSAAPVKADWAAADEAAANFAAPEAGRPIAIRGEDGNPAIKGNIAWTARPDGTIAGDISLECVAPITLQCLALAAQIPAEPASGLGDSRAQTYDIPIAGGRSLRLVFDRPHPYHAQDSRPWGGAWTVRFGDTRRIRNFAKGDVVSWHVIVSDPSGAPLELSVGKPVTIAEGEDWVRLDYKKDVAAGSALDFSGMGLQDAPAGKHGWLKAVGGHFEFESLPGVEQRFYGVNLCFSANYPDHDLADRIVERFVRCGYNSIRVHHHDGAWAAAYAARLQRSTLNLSTFQPTTAVDVVNDDIDRLDYLLARCFERGIYVTTDLYVSRPVKWRDIGIDRDGEMNKGLYKTYVGVYEPAFQDWCEHARAFLEHVNPYTGRAYKDEPGMPLISLVNEGKLGMKWGEAKKGEDPNVQAAWREFCAGGARGEDSPRPLPNPGEPGFDEFDDWVNRRIYERGGAFVRSLGCRALLTNDNNGRWHGEGEGLTPLYDYVDSHFYVDHPQFLDQSWKLPSRCDNNNPVRTEKPAIFHRGWSKGASKPYAITEWNFSGPGRYRGMGGILTGALAAEQEWDGLWRFAYSHSNRNLLDEPLSNPGYFDCVTDPLIAASDRASVCLYLGGLPSALTLDKERGSMTIVSPLLCGGFAESGRIEAGSMSFEIVESRKSKVESQIPDVGRRPSKLSTSQPFNLSTEGGGHSVPATLWVTSLDGAPLPSSSRMLLVHLTDVQGEGTRYADEARQIITKWGKGCLAECGEAEVELLLAAGATPTVYSLDTAGNRTGEVPSRIEDGALRFRVSTRGPDGKGCIYYEIAR
ncbi:MAG: hypothetical protein ILM98_06095 [Kiritimatiellae bacterium]|nr:hypothetical protein [Kiritimatiellia bacterium]